MNSNVLCSVANARLILENNLVESGELAKLSVEINPANPLAWWSLAHVQLYSGEVASAHAAAKMAQGLAAGSTLRFWTDFLMALIDAVTGRTDEAIRRAELSASLSTNFRPPLRYLIALYAMRDQRESAVRSGRRLKAIEPDFSVDRLISDSSYPVSMMRRAGLIHRGRLLELEI